MFKQKAFLLLLAAALLLSAASPLSAGPSRKNRFGLGLGVGIPSSVFLTGKYWLRGNGNLVGAVDMAVSGGNGWIGGSLDYLFHRFYVFKGDLGKRLPLYFGGGAALAAGANNNLAIAVQGKAGVTYFFDAPFDFYLEAVPAVALTPQVGLNVGLQLGGRYYW